MTTSTMVGAGALALAELLFGRAPADRYVAPAIGDWQTAHGRESSLTGRLALRLRYTASLATSFLFMTSRAEGDGALARLWPAIVASIIGVLVLREPEVRPALATQQLLWLGVGIAVFLAIAAAGRRVFAKVEALSVATALAGIALLVSGASSWRLPLVGLVVVPSELIKVPALLLAVAVATGSMRSRLAAGSALAVVCAGLLRTQEPQGIAVILATAAGALWTVVPAARRAVLAAGSASIAAALVAFPARSFPSPDPHTDRIAASALQAFGLPGLLVLGAALVAVFYLPARQARAESGPARAAAAALIAGLGVQTALHLLCELGVGPVLGVPLPLATYGGSSTVALYASLAIVLAAARSARYEKECTSDTRIALT